MKIKIPKKIIDYWSSYKNKFNKNDYYKGDNPVIGNLYWIVPNEVIWIYTTNREEGYDGSQTQIGIKKDGTIVWGYFSHCSCYGYEEYGGEFEELSEDNLIHTEKYYEISDVPIDILKIIKNRIKEISKEELK